MLPICMNSEWRKACENDRLAGLPLVHRYVQWSSLLLLLGWMKWLQEAKKRSLAKIYSVFPQKITLKCLELASSSTWVTYLCFKNLSDRSKCIRPVPARCNDTRGQWWYFKDVSWILKRQWWVLLHTYLVCLVHSLFWHYIPAILEKLNAHLVRAEFKHEKSPRMYSWDTGLPPSQSSSLA